MGEGRYFTAHGAPSQRGRGPNGWGHDDAQAPDLFEDDAAGSQAYWPSEAPGMMPGYAVRPAQAPRADGGFRYADNPYASAAPYASGPAPDHADWSGQGGHAAHDPVPPYGQAYGQGQGRPAAPAPDRMRAGPPPISTTGLARGLGAVMSLALIIGAGVWTWQMMQRDVSGVPVVRALEGPVRFAPENPGGSQAAHQGLSVNELAADGASALPDQVVLAPQPLDLTQELSRPARNNAPEAGQEVLIEVGMPISTETDDFGPAVAPTALGFVTPNRSAVTRSPRPAARGVQTARPSTQPTGLADQGASVALAAAVANSVAADLSRVGGLDVDPASIGPGTRLVQLGAYDSAAEARSAWDGLAQRFSPLLDDRGRVIEAAHSGGSVFFRLRAHGFTDERDARRFCAALIDQRLDCIPVLIR